MRSNENLIGPSIDIPTYDQFESAINPSFRLPPNGAGGIGTLADIYLHPNWCPGNGVPVPGGAGALNVQRPCAEAISADDPGTYALNFRNEPIGLRVFEDANLNGQLDPGEDTNGNGVLDQVAGAAGDLAFAYQSRTDRAIPELNSQPAGPYPGARPVRADRRASACAWTAVHCPRPVSRAARRHAPSRRARAVSSRAPGPDRRPAARILRHSLRCAPARRPCRRRS